MSALARAGELGESFRICHDLVRESDEVRATALLFAPADRRDALAALYAFDIETAAVRDRVRQPIAGEIRLQWWRDGLANAAASVPGEGDEQGAPVLAAIALVIRAFDLPLDAFERLLEARLFDLYDDPIGPREAFEAYSGETDGAVVILAAMILDRSRAPQVAALAGHAGVAMTAFRIARREEMLRRRGQVMVPDEVLAALGLDADRYRTVRDGGTVRTAILALASEHAAIVAARWGEIPAELRSAFLAVRAAEAEAATASRSRVAGPRRALLFWRLMRAPTRAA